MAEKDKSKKDEKDTVEEVPLSGTGRPLFPHEGDPVKAAEATSYAAPVEAKEAEPGNPVVDPNPAYDPEAPENQPESENPEADSKK